MTEISEKCGSLEKHPILLKKESESESALGEPDLCEEDSASSDSASSGRVKTSRQEKAHLMAEAGEGLNSPWQYNVTKIDCIVKTEQSNPAIKQEDVDTTSFGLSDPQGNSNKRKVNNVENTIFQMAFKRSKIALKEQQGVNALERDLRLQKSLSEECEDLGVDEPSTSDLFPEAELLLDPDHSSRDSQLELANETFTQAINSSSSCDSGAVSPLLAFGRRPVTYRSSQRNQSLNKNTKFVPIYYNSLYQLSEESPSATMSTSRDGSPVSPILSYRLKGSKFCCNSETSSPYMTKSMGKKENSLLLNQKTYNRDALKSNSSGASTPINGGSTESPSNEDRINSCISEDSESVQKQSDEKEMEVVDTTTDSDSNIECVNITSRETSSESKVFHSNPTSSLPFTYGENKSSHKGFKPKGQMKQDMWKSLLKGTDIKDDVDSDMSDHDQLRVSDKRSTSTEDDVQSESESRAKNGLGAESEDALSNNDRVMRSSKKSKKRTGSQLRAPSKNKSPRRPEPHEVENFFTDLPSSTGACKFPSTHQHQHDLSNRRSSLRGHSKGDCACCQNTDKQKQPVLKTDKFITTETPTTLCVSKKKLHSKTTVKSSHITKKR